MTDAGLAHVESLSKLEFLVLDGTKLTHAGVARLQGLAGLKRFRLAGTAVTPDGESALKKATPGLMIER